MEFYIISQASFCVFTQLNWWRNYCLVLCQVLTKGTVWPPHTPLSFSIQCVCTSPRSQHCFLVLQNKRGSQLCGSVGIWDNLVGSFMISCCCMCSVYQLKSSFLCPSPSCSHTAPHVWSILALFLSSDCLACKKWCLSTNVFLYFSQSSLYYQV